MIPIIHATMILVRAFPRMVRMKCWIAVHPTCWPRKLLATSRLPWTGLVIATAGTDFAWMYLGVLTM